MQPTQNQTYACQKPDEVIDGINIIYTSSDQLLAIYDALYLYIQEKFTFVRDHEVLKLS